MKLVFDAAIEKNVAAVAGIDSREATFPGEPLSTSSITDDILASAAVSFTMIAEAASCSGDEVGQEALGVKEGPFVLTEVNLERNRLDLMIEANEKARKFERLAWKGVVILLLHCLLR